MLRKLHRHAMLSLTFALMPPVTFVGRQDLDDTGDSFEWVVLEDQDTGVLYRAQMRVFS